MEISVETCWNIAFLNLFDIWDVFDHVLQYIGHKIKSLVSFYFHFLLNDPVQPSIDLFLYFILFHLSQGRCLFESHFKIVMYIVCSVWAIQYEYLEHFAYNAEPLGNNPLIFMEILLRASSWVDEYLPVVLSKLQVVPRICF